MTKLGIGIVGCGVIADIYCRNTPRFADIEMRACADLRADAATALADKYGLRACTPGDLFGADDIDIVLNLTVPNAHVDVSSAALLAGKHVYSEKPLATSLAGARELSALAERQGRQIAVAPDTILGPGGQVARRLIDDGEIGTVTAGTAFVMSRGMEHWHPSPTFFFQPGGGPVFDMGPYYITQLVQLLGPVARVLALSATGIEERVVTAPGPMQGQSIRPQIPTTVMGLLDFEAGAKVMYGASWDVEAHGHKPLELYGTKASLRVPDPNFMGGIVELGTRAEGWRELPTKDHLFGAANYPFDAPIHANDRGLGIAEFAQAIKRGRTPRLAGGLGLHVTAVMEGLLVASQENRIVTIDERCARPAALSEEEAGSLLAR
ncbi:MAG TPA: Gfo/Idh/MocA family oxidoreductase [Geminicoccus sp.]|jgi:predicted dehydrogenase|uniref:Gfo/Idh/MocA family protein n=1 Tax=Geminicoccus sp. TaxID=2024832 RepID=UPI002E2FAA75|nr:Gfo/Idh/MocA family oxidoreductase [Geminicoccus sp.]HEX2529591.1 Gfo/Idh/MocA family oxidoreductase [Geminicoccus sp.]